MRLWWRHAILRILRFDPVDQRASVRVAGNNCRLILLVRILMRCKSKLSAVQSQARFPPSRIRTMACITVFRQNWLDRVIKGELLGVFFWNRSWRCLAGSNSSEEAQA